MSDEPRRYSLPPITLGWVLRLLALIAAILWMAHSPWPPNALGWSWVLFLASFVF